MRKISALTVATVFTGSFLGAGFLSGQELLQFFGVFGGYGLVGMILAICAFCLFSALVLYVARRTGQTAFDRIIVKEDLPWLRTLVSAIFLFFLFDVLVAMVAGAGALLEQLFGLPAAAGNALMTALILLVALTGTSGLLASFNIVVPLLAAVAAVVSLLSPLALSPAPIQARPFSAGNPLLGNWFLSTLSFVSYNMMAAVSILAPLSRGMEDPRTVRRGLAAGTGLLALIFTCILLPMILYQGDLGAAELPMLELAYRVASPLGTLYALLLFAGMFTGGLSSLYGITARGQADSGGRGERKHVVFLCLLSFAGSLFGFTNLVRFVYPICGYAGFFALLGIFRHALLLYREKI